MGQGDELVVELSLIPSLGEVVVIVLSSQCMRACSRLEFVNVYKGIYSGLR
jgi:hypothetical protein